MVSSFGYQNTCNNTNNYNAALKGQSYSGFNGLRHQQTRQDTQSFQYPTGMYDNSSMNSQFSCEKENLYMPQHHHQHQHQHHVQVYPHQMQQVLNQTQSQTGVASNSTTASALNVFTNVNVMRPIPNSTTQSLAFNHQRNMFPSHIQVEDEHDNEDEDDEEVLHGAVSPLIQKPAPVNLAAAAVVVPAEKEHLQYTHEIIAHLKSTENKFNSKGGYIGVIQSEINERMRGILLDWLVEVHYKFKLRTETLFITVNLIDRYLEKVDLKSSQLQLLGITALFVAAKYEETYSVPHMKDLVYVCDNAYVKEEIFTMEGSILTVLDFNVLSVSSFRFLDYFVECEELGSGSSSSSNSGEKKNYFLARYLTEIALLEYKLIGVSASLLAAAIIYLVNKIRKRPIAWKQAMVDTTGYAEHEIRPCAKQICHIVQSIDSRKYLSSLRKKFQSTQFLEVSKIKIEQRRETTNERSSTPNNGQGIQNAFNVPASSVNAFEPNLTNISSSVLAPHLNDGIINSGILTETTSHSQTNNNNNNSMNQEIPLNEQQQQCYQVLPDQLLQQVEFVDITVPIQTSMILIEKRMQSMKEGPSSVVEAILTNRLCSENAANVELKVPAQIIVRVIEKKITNVTQKQLCSLSVTFAKVVTESMFNTQEMLQIPAEFTNFMIDSIISQSLRNRTVTL